MTAGTGSGRWDMEASHTSTTIFCPNGHLVLDQAQCEQCGWIRPAERPAGGIVWGPVDMGAELGGPGRDVFAASAAAQGVAVFPLSSGELVGVNLADGRVRWRAVLEVGLATHRLVADGRRLLASLCDHRLLLPTPQAGGAGSPAGPGKLIAIDPMTGKMTDLWHSDSPMITDPVLTPDYILVRTPGIGLAALSRETHPKLIWNRPLETWWTMPPFVAGDRVLLDDGRPMQGIGRLRTVALDGGRLLDELTPAPMLSHLPVQISDRVFVRSGASRVLALEIESLSEVWHQDFTRLYGGLCAGMGMLYLTARGAAPSGASGHYLLQALQPADGKPVWEAPLPAGRRPRVGPMLIAGLLLLACDDGSLLAYRPGDARPLWSIALGAADDPPRTELLAAQGILLAGTAFGKLTAIQFAQAAVEPCSPHEALAHGRFEDAANAYALCGDLQKAAEIYARDLSQPLKALLLLEQGKLWQPAAALAETKELYSRALDYYVRLEDLAGQARSLQAMGDHLAAARKYLESGDLSNAALCFEEGQDPGRALECYRKLGDAAAVRRLMQILPPDVSKLDYLVESGSYEEAAAMAMQLGYYRRAVDLYSQLEQPSAEIEALFLLAKVEPERWVWERIASLARRLGRFQDEAGACVELDQPIEAALAFQRAAEQTQNRFPALETEIADLYERAYRLYEDQGMDLEAAHCWQRIVQCRRMPWVIILKGTAAKAFTEEVFNTLVVTLKNTGSSAAHRIRIHADSERFELDRTSTEMENVSIPPGRERPVDLRIRPLKGHVGDLALVLKWEWQDKDARPFSQKMNWPVDVKRTNEPGGSGTPVEIHYHGPVYQAQENIEIIGQDKIGGDKIGGDRVEAGGQKGDKVVISRGGAKPPRLCPNCGLQIERIKDRHCQVCGEALNN